MATVSQVIQERLTAYSVELNAVRLDAALIDADLDGSVNYDKSKVLPVKQVILSVITELLATPDVTEGGYTVKWDRAAVQAYCNQLRNELGLVSTSSPVVRDRSNLW